MIHSRVASSLVAVAGMLLVGIVIGAGLTFGTFLASGYLSGKTVTSTITQTSTEETTVSTTLTSTVYRTFATTSTSNPQFAEVSVAVTSCTLAGAAPNRLVCTLTVSNSGTLDVVIDGCTIDVGGSAVASTPAAGSTSLMVKAGSTDSGVSCSTNSTAPEPALGSQSTGTLTLNDGGQAPFSGTWS